MNLWRRVRRCSFVCVLAAPVVAGATTLSEAWLSAKDHDRRLALAGADRGLAQARRAQADALFRPQVDVSVAAGVGGSKTRVTGAAFEAPSMPRSEGVLFETSIPAGGSGRAGLTLRKPLLDRALTARQTQLRLAADADELKFMGESAQGILRLAQRYFDSALADAQVQLLEHQQEAVRRAAVEARDRFKIGSVAVTDTHEADAALAAVQAEQADAAVKAGVARQALIDLTGLRAPQAHLPVRAPQAHLPVRAPVVDADRSTHSSDQPQALEDWLRAAQEHNLRLRQQRTAVQAAKQGVAEHDRNARWSVDLLAEVRHDRLRGDAHYGSGSAEQLGTQYGVAVQWSMPLYDGGRRDARQLQALRELDKAQAALALAEEEVGLSLREHWMSEAAASERVRALEDAVKAGSSRLDATRIGYGIGERTLLDRLDAENALARTRLSLHQARIDAWLNRLRMLAIVDGLDERALAMIDAVAPAGSSSAAQRKER